MASSNNKTLLILLCALFALAIIVSAEVSSTTASEGDAKDVDQYERGGGGYQGGGGNYGRGGGGNYGRGGSGNYGRGGGGGGGGGGRCRYGCCRGYRYSYGCSRCCALANEAPDAFFADDVKN
ncbi:unnamed protein product [Linum trigynum]|uniref:Glycine-rich protein n=1 Tax=Linum trigynum TaxID=586398 RepID=A0AAV2EJM1_9ROSI